MTTQGWNPQIDEPFDPLNLAGVVRGCDRPGGKCEFCPADVKHGYIGLVLCERCFKNVKRWMAHIAVGEVKP
jgi:hypothetical protein